LKGGGKKNQGGTPFLFVLKIFFKKGGAGEKGFYLGEVLGFAWWGEKGSGWGSGFGGLSNGGINGSPPPPPL